MLVFFRKKALIKPVLQPISNITVPLYKFLPGATEAVHMNMLIVQGHCVLSINRRVVVVESRLLATFKHPHQPAFTNTRDKPEFRDTLG